MQGQNTTIRECNSHIKHHTTCNPKRTITVSEVHDPGSNPKSNQRHPKLVSRSGGYLVTRIEFNDHIQKDMCGEKKWLHLAVGDRFL